MGTAELPAGFWDRPEVTGALGRRDIGALLDMIRAASGLSQQKLGAVTGLSQTQISHYISGKNRPTLDIIRRIADGVDMPCRARVSLGLAAAPDPGLPDRTGEVRLHRILALAEYIGRTGDTSQLGIWRDLTRPGSGTEPWDRLGEVITAQNRTRPAHPSGCRSAPPGSTWSPPNSRPGSSPGH
jgi:transcriptional regulator with XRE-family HTH domain